MYDVAKDEWSTVRTTGDRVTRPAEGASCVVGGGGTDGENLGIYFSGHLDDHTVEDWSNQVARVYLSSTVYFDLGSNEMTNITSYSNNATSGANSQPEIPPVHRADGTLTYVPGLGTNKEGILVSIGGATDDQFVDNSVLDVYDIGAQGWTKQATLGNTMGTRINHCAVRATAKINGEITHQIFVYGGQQLNQSDRDSALYVLNIQKDEFTWVFVGDNLPSQPTGRAGHQCALVGNQMVVIGGVVASNVLCETPGVFVLNVTSLNWQANYKANTMYQTPELIANITGGVGTGGSTSGSGWALGGDGTQFPDTSKPQGGGNSGGSGGGSIGGNGSGSGSGAAGDQGGSGSGSSNSGGGSNAGAIAGGVVGGLAALAALAVLALWLMRKRRRERQMAEAAAARDKLGGGLAPLRSDSGSSDGPWGAPHEKPWGPGGYYGSYARRPSGSVDHSSATYGPASDDIEEETRGMEAAFASPHLVPRQPLRVTNPEISADD